MKTNSKSILFVTGAFVSHKGWDNWKTYFEERGYTTLAPAWPYKDAPPHILRNRHPDEDIASLDLNDVVAFYKAAAESMPEPPIIIGHSMGGLMTQLLIQKKAGIAGVMIHSVPPQGVLSFKWSFLKSVTETLGLFTSIKKTYLMSFPHWQYTFTNGMSLEDQKSSYEESVLPESKRALRGALTSKAKIDFKAPHVPLLFVSGNKDNIIPASLNYSNFKKYKHKDSVTDYMEFEDSNHHVLQLPTWENEAEFIACWLEKHV